MVIADALQLGLLIAAIVLAITAFVVSYWAGNANLDYIREYGTRTGTSEELFPVRLPDVQQRYALRPWLWLVEGPQRMWRTLRISARHASDPELERLRQRYQLRRQIQILVGLAALVAVTLAFWPR